MRSTKARRNRHVTWSPVIQEVSRPCTKHDTIDSEQTTCLLELQDGHENVQVKRGIMTAHSRRSTHNLLLTIRNGKHRDLQLLINLPNRSVCRVYDGKHAWDVVDRSDMQMMVDMQQMNTITWVSSHGGEESNTVRENDARGFDVSWLKQKMNLFVVRSSRRERVDTECKESVETLRADDSSETTERAVELPWYSAEKVKRKRTRKSNSSRNRKTKRKQRSNGKKSRRRKGRHNN